MNNNLVKIVVVLDASGSMNTILGPTISGFNTFLETQKQHPGDVQLTVVKFDSFTDFSNGSVRPRPRLIYLCRDVPIKEFKGLTSVNYRPEGGTPLYYTQCTLIDEVGAELARTPENDRPGKVMFVTITDGADTDHASHPLDLGEAGVARRIKHQTDNYKWDFTYIGANQDAEAVGAKMGIPLAKSLSYNSTAEGVKDAFTSVSTYASAVRCCVSQNQDTTNVGYSDQDKAAHVGLANLSRATLASANP